MSKPGPAASNTSEGGALLVSEVEQFARFRVVEVHISRIAEELPYGSLVYFINRLLGLSGDLQFFSSDEKWSSGFLSLGGVEPVVAPGVVPEWAVFPAAVAEVVPPSGSGEGSPWAGVVSVHAVISSPLRSDLRACQNAPTAAMVGKQAPLSARLNEPLGPRR